MQNGVQIFFSAKSISGTLLNRLPIQSRLCTKIVAHTLTLAPVITEPKPGTKGHLSLNLHKYNEEVKAKIFSSIDEAALSASAVSSMAFTRSILTLAAK
jgi:hypothetical protein